MNQHQEVGRPLSEAQRQHLAPLIANLNIAATNLNAAKTIQQAQDQQVERRQKEYDAAEDAANAFLRYCGREHGIPLDTGEWDFDTKGMSFFRLAPQPQAQLHEPPQPKQEQPSDESREPSGQSMRGVNGVVEHAQNLT